MPPKSAPKEAAAAKPAAAPKPAAKAAEAPKKEAPKPAKEEKKEAPKAAAAAKTEAPKAAAAKAPAAKPAEKKAPAAPAAEKKVEAPKAEKKPSVAANGVHVKNWGKDGREAAQQTFASCGKVVDVRVRRDHYALVWFDNAAAVKKAIENFNGKTFKGKQLTVSAAKSAPAPSKTENSKTVFVSPVFRASTTRKQVIEFFNKFGKVVRLRTYRQNYAFVYFDNSASAQRAVKEVNGQQFRGRTVQVKLSVRTLENDRKKEENRKKRIAVNHKLRDDRKKAKVVAARKKPVVKTAAAGAKPVKAK